MNEKVLIFGSNGYFGSKLKEHFKANHYIVLTPEIDIRDYNTVKINIAQYQPDIVINATGITGSPNVDWCEDNKAEVMSVNINGATNIAFACDQLGVYLVHLGSGCIYEGNNNGKGFFETDEPNFFGSFYSRTKFLSEKMLSEFNVLQLRIRIPIESESNPKNVINKLLKYEKIISVNNSFTVVEDFIPAVDQLIKKREKGIFNMTNVGYMDHEFLMQKYKEIVDPNYEFTVMSIDELYKKYAKTMRSNCILNTDKREALGVHMPNIKERVVDLLTQYKKKKEAIIQDSVLSI